MSFIMKNCSIVLSTYFNQKRNSIVLSMYLFGRQCPSRIHFVQWRQNCQWCDFWPEWRCQRKGPPEPGPFCHRRWSPYSVFLNAHRRWFWCLELIFWPYHLIRPTWLPLGSFPLSPFHLKKHSHMFKTKKKKMEFSWMGIFYLVRKKLWLKAIFEINRENFHTFQHKTRYTCMYSKIVFLRKSTFSLANFNMRSTRHKTRSKYVCCYCS